MSNRAVRVLFALAVLWAAALAGIHRASAFTVSPKIGIFAGHEEITRQAIIFAEKIIKEDLGINSELFQLVSQDMTDLENLLLGLSGKNSSNPLIRGNFAMDHPERDKYNWEIDLPKFFNVDPENWHTDARTQGLHALRKYLPGEQLDSAYNACMSVRENIQRLTLAGIYNWLEVLKNFKAQNKFLTDTYRRYALFYFGAATHVLQDSFSPAHTARDPKMRNNNNVVDFCFYDPSPVKDGIKRGIKHAAVSFDQAIYITGPIQEMLMELIEDNHRRFEKGLTCLHSTYDIRDRLWIRAPWERQTALENEWASREQEYWDDANRWRLISYDAVKLCEGNIMSSERGKHQCLKHEGRLARAATMKYLIALTKYLYGERERLLTKEPQVLKMEVERMLRTQLFEGDVGVARYGLNQTMPEGALRCDHLPRQSQKMVLKL